MIKKLFSVTALGALLASSAFADDFLAKVSNGALSDNSAGVKVLSLDEMKDVKGGYFTFDRASQYDNIVGIRSYAYIAGDSDKTSQQFLQAMNISGDKIILAKYRYVNNQKEYYLQSYEKSTGTLRDIWAWNGSYALQVLNDFKSRY
ncbi:hypothetical protein [Campylobacter estrildidarum]|uniref:Bacteriocin-type signal sequence domain-containing protein n=1 Tax=Campylobacter estrildidarum TaxID=2510189 RepID=A0A4U7BAU6_9BACT|nr:hypothetical protein [Campylobacter estrildidarum]TKX28009.1 hypothetical protein CQA69_08890 [Campylobacter estrildidarum]